MRSRKEFIKQLNSIVLINEFLLKKKVNKRFFFLCKTWFLNEPAAVAFGDFFFAMSVWETICVGFFQNLPGSVQVLRVKDVPFLTSAAQDGRSPSLSAPCEQEKALFVPSLKAQQCGYLILFQINISGNFRWLCSVKGTLYPSTVLCLQGTMGGC